MPLSTAATFDFNHMNLVPHKCVVDSRAECDTSVQIGGRRFKLPVVPANMECVIDENIAVALASAGYFYIQHRFNINVVEFARKMHTLGLPISISVGVNDASRTELTQLVTAGLMPDYITIDIAHGHAVRMEHMIQWIRENIGAAVFIIAGNVSTANATRDLVAWGANAVKVGIGPGSACTTYDATGFGSRGIQAAAIAECAAAVKGTEALLVADGGITHPGDIAKALVLGAHVVMIGGMFSGLIDSPGKTVYDAAGHPFKEFWGSASAFQSGKTTRIEGTKKLIPQKPRTYADEMKYLHECLQSAISYGGGRNLDCFANVEYVIK